MTVLEGNIAEPSGLIKAATIHVADGRIRHVKTYHHPEPELPIILPGFIDVHVHGGGGADTMDATFDAFHTISKTHAKYGTTSLLLTTLTESSDRIDAVLDTFIRHRGEGNLDGNILGIHLEGPFINRARSGAQNPAHIREPDVILSRKWFDSGAVRMITMAPELPGAHHVAKEAISKNIVVSAGHTECKQDDLQRAWEAGYSHVTHLCNAMPLFTHFDVGPIGHVIDDDHFTADFICDGIHIQKPMVKALVRSIGTDRLMMITDATRATDKGDGTYELGGLSVHVQNGACRLLSGVLAGSILTMANAARNVFEMLGLSLYEVQKLTSLNAANKLGLTTKGRIKQDMDADLVVMDSSFNVITTMVGGHIIYSVD